MSEDATTPPAAATATEPTEPTEPTVSTVPTVPSSPAATSPDVVASGDVASEAGASGAGAGAGAGASGGAGGASGAGAGAGAGAGGPSPSAVSKLSEPGAAPERVAAIVTARLAAPDVNIFQLVRESCAAFLKERAAAGTSHSSVDAEAVAKVAAELVADMDTFRSKADDDVAIPLRFADVDAAIDFYVTLNLLNFGSGWRHPLHKAVDRGAYMTVVACLMSLYMTVSKMDAETLSGITTDQVAQWSGVPATVDIEVMPAVYKVAPAPLAPFMEDMTRTLNEAGRVLLGLGFVDFAHYIRDTVATHGCVAAPLVARFVRDFPAFRDVHMFGDTTVWLCKKAQIALAQLQRLYGEKHPDLLAFTDVNDMTVFSDNVLPAVLREMGAVSLSDTLAEVVDGRTDLPAGSVETELRAAAVVAAQAIVKAADGAFTEVELDYYLWNIGKDPEYRSVERHATKNTVMY